MTPYVCPKCEGERERITDCAVCDGAGVLWHDASEPVDMARIIEEIRKIPTMPIPQPYPVWPSYPRWPRWPYREIIWHDTTNRTTAGDPNAGRPVTLSVHLGKDELANTVIEAVGSSAAVGI